MDYQEETAQNEKVFYEILRAVRPDLFELAALGDPAQFNFHILTRVMRQLLNIQQFTKWGRVELTVNNGVVTLVGGTNSEKADEPITQTSRCS